MNIETNKLGLPLEYQMLPELFDAHNITNNTNATNKIIEKLLRQHGVKTVLDLSCGTGSQFLFFFFLFYSIIKLLLFSHNFSNNLLLFHGQGIKRCWFNVKNIVFY